MADTRSDEISIVDAEAPRAVPHLLRVLAAHAPAEAPQRHALVDLDEVYFGRTAAGDAIRAGAQLRVGVSGSAASERHARLSRSMGRYGDRNSGSARPSSSMTGSPQTYARSMRSRQYAGRGAR